MCLRKRERETWRDSQRERGEAWSLERVMGLSLGLTYELYLRNKTNEKYHYTISFIYLCFPRGQYGVAGQSATHVDAV